MSVKGQGDPGEDHASRVGAESPCNDMKRAVVKQLIERYFYQLTEGCGNSDCDNQNCASSGKVTNLTPNQAAAQAIQLFSQEARLCDGTQPSKVARITLEPGPASLAKSLPVKSVNPTCSDEGTTSHSSTNPVPLVEVSLLSAITSNTNIGNSIDIANESDAIPGRATDTDTHKLPENQSFVNTNNRAESVSQQGLTASFSSIKTRSNNIYDRRQFPAINVNCIASALNKCMSSDEENFSKILDRHKIYIKNFNSKPTRKRKSKINNIKELRIRCKPRKRLRSFKNTTKAGKNILSKKRTSMKSCSRFLTKLLVLAWYLRHIESKRYRNYALKSL